MCGSAAPFSASAADRDLLNQDSGLPPEARQQPAQARRGQGDAAGRRLKSGSGNVDKDGAAPAGDAWPCIVIQFDNVVVDMVLAPQPVAGMPIRQKEVLVIAAIFRIFAPRVEGCDRTGGEPRRWPSRTVGPPPQPDRPEAAARRAAIALALIGLDPGSPKRHRNCSRSSDQPTLCPITGAAGNADPRHGYWFHHQPHSKFFSGDGRSGTVKLLPIVICALYVAQTYVPL